MVFAILNFQWKKSIQIHSHTSRGWQGAMELILFCFNMLLLLRSLKFELLKFSCISSFYHFTILGLSGPPSCLLSFKDSFKLPNPSHTFPGDLGDLFYLSSPISFALSILCSEHCLQQDLSKADVQGKRNAFSRHK